MVQVCDSPNSEAQPVGGTPYIQMIAMIVIFFMGCDRQFSIFLGLLMQNSLKR